MNSSNNKRKIYVLSTHAPLANPNITKELGEENIIILPKLVLANLRNNYCSRNDEYGKSAKKFLDYISTLDINALISKEGIEQENGSILRIVSSEKSFHDTNIPNSLSSLQKEILEICQELKIIYKSSRVILVSKNLYLRIEAIKLDIEAETYKDELLPEISEQYTGRREIEVSSEIINLFYENEKNNTQTLSSFLSGYYDGKIYENMFITLSCGSQSVLCRKKGNNLVPLVFTKSRPSKIAPRNAGQKFMQEALMTSYKEAPVVIIKGQSGTAKTLYSLAVALEQVNCQNPQYKKILYTRATIESGESIGFLPGTEKEKIDPYLRPAYDNLEELFNNKEQSENNDGWLKLFESGIIYSESIAFLRGRSIKNTFIIIDEAQNLTKEMVKLIVTRLGEGSKIVLLGDPQQIDNPKCTERSNGLSYISERSKGQPLVWQVKMYEEECERSPIAELMSKIL